MDDVSYGSNSLTTGARLTDAFPTLQSSGRQRTRVLDFHSGRKCPTCGGTGKIPKGQDDQLVALIPYSDERLKPRKQWICITFVILSVLLTLAIIVGVILAIFMFPRDVDITFNNCSQMNVTIELKDHPIAITTRHQLSKDNISKIILEVETNFTVKNNNFFSLHVDQLNVTLAYLDSFVSGYSSSSSNLAPIGSRKTKNMVVSQNITFQEGNARRVYSTCFTTVFPKLINLEIEITLAYVYLTHSSDTVVTFHKLLDCDFSDTPPPI